MKRAVVVGVGALASVLAVAACSSRPKVPPGKETKPAGQRVVNRDGGAPAAADTAPPSVPSRAIATLGGKSIGPFTARGAGGAAIATWIANDDAGARRLFALPIGAGTNEKTEGWSLSTVPAETTALVVRAAGDRAGFFAAWSAILDRGEVLAVLSLGADGSAKGTVVDVARTNDHVVWLEIVPTPRGALCVWAEETRDGEANILAVALEADGKMRGLPTRVAHGASGWQAVAAGDGAGIAVVSPPDAKKTKTKAKGGALSWVRIDADARVVGAPTPIATAPTVSGDVDVVAAGGGYVFAWTDRTGEDAEVELASIDATGRVQGPKRAMDSVGGGTLAALATGKAGVVLAWDEAMRKSQASRRMHVAKIALGALAAEEIAVIAPQGRGAPEIAPTDAGFAMLFPAVVCAQSPCVPAGIAPTFVRFDAQGSAVETQPIRVGDKHDPAAVAWALDCAGDRCTALAALGATPTPVSVVDLAPRATPFHPPVVPPRPAGAPRVTALKTLAGGEPLAEVAAARVGDGALVATITSAVEDDDDKKKKGATVQVRELDANGDTKGAPFVVTTRARTSGGVAIASGDAPEDGAVVAWTAKDGAHNQVHVTKLNAKGRRTNEVQLTSSKGGASDVAIAWAGGGWMVAWVDQRDGNGEVYAARLDKDLNRTSKEERITNAQGDAGDVALLVQGERTYLAWADPRDSSKDNFSDIWFATLKTKDATRSGDETRVLATAAHSRSPSIAMAVDLPAIAWIEEAPMGLDANNMGAYGAMYVRMVGGRPLRDPVRLALAGEGLATAIALELTRAGVHAYVTRATRSDIVVDALDINGNDVTPFTLLAHEGPPSIDVALAPLGGWLFYADESGEPGERRLRRATLLWRR